MDTKKLILFTDLDKKTSNTKSCYHRNAFFRTKLQSEATKWKDLRDDDRGHLCARVRRTVWIVFWFVFHSKVSWEALHIVFTRISIIETDIVIWEGAVSEIEGREGDDFEQKESRGCARLSFRDERDDRPFSRTSRAGLPCVSPGRKSEPPSPGLDPSTLLDSQSNTYPPLMQLNPLSHNISVSPLTSHTLSLSLSFRITLTRNKTFHFRGRGVLSLQYAFAWTLSWRLG